MKAAFFDWLRAPAYAPADKSVAAGWDIDKGIIAWLVGRETGCPADTAIAAVQVEVDRRVTASEEVSVVSAFNLIDDCVRRVHQMQEEQECNDSRS